METECGVRNSHKRSSYIYRHCLVPHLSGMGSVHPATTCQTRKEL